MSFNVCPDSTLDFVVNVLSPVVEGAVTLLYFIFIQPPVVIVRNLILISVPVI